MQVKVKLNSPTIEIRLLHLAMSNIDAMDECINTGVISDMFATARNKILYDNMASYFANQNAVVIDDVEQFLQNIEYSNNNDKLGTKEAVESILEYKRKDGKPIEMRMLNKYIAELKRMYKLRKVVSIHKKLSQELCTEDKTYEDILEIISQYSDIEYAISDDTHHTMEDVIRSSTKEILDEANQPSAIKFYLSSLDKNAKIVSGYVTYVAGDSGIGKSAFLLHLAYQMSKNGVKVLYITPEMNITDCGKRIISMNTGIPSKRLMMPSLLEESDWELLTQQYEKTSENPENIFWNDDTEMDIPKLRNEIIQGVRKHDIDVILIDYYQLLYLNLKENLPDSQRIPRVSRALNVLASKKYVRPNGQTKKICIVALAQLNKEVLYNTDKHPTMYDLYFGGYKDARLVLGLYREEYYKPNTPFQNLLEIGILKQNNGVTNEWFDAFYDKETYQIRELSKDEKTELSELRKQMQRQDTDDEDE